MRAALRGRGRFILGLVLLHGSAGWAQTIYYYKAEFHSMTTMQEKQLHMELAALDPAGVAVLDHDAVTLDWKTTRRTDRFQLEYRIGRYGLSIVSYHERTGNEEPTVRVPRKQHLADMPVYMDTGDPVRDNQRYDAYKAAWIAAHPEQYEELTAPAHTDPMHTNE